MTLHVSTPYIESRPYSIRTGKTVLFKIEALQPTGSFKARGIGHACQVYKTQGARRFISSSGGNAGLAVAYAGRKLETPVTVVVPETTSERAKALIRMENAQVLVHGASWQEAHQTAMSLTNADSVLIHPFDDALLWTGHASMVDEMQRQGPKPDVIILSVGGGGLLCGVVEGLQRNQWRDVPVIAVETAGADSYSQSLRAGKQIQLDAITSIASSLGARAVCAKAMENAVGHPIESIVVSDAQAVDACVQLMEDLRLIVEPACGASLAALNSDSAYLKRAATVAVIICGGVGSTAKQLAELQSAS